MTAAEDYRRPRWGPQYITFEEYVRRAAAEGGKALQTLIRAHGRLKIEKALGEKLPSASYEEDERAAIEEEK